MRRFVTLGLAALLLAVGQPACLRALGLVDGSDAAVDGDAEVDSDADADAGPDSDDDGDGATDADAGGDADSGGPASCLDLLASEPGLPSGEYTIYPEGTPVVVYCDMTHDGGGWTRVASFDAASDDCPGEWVQSVGEPDVCVVGSPGAEGASRSALFAPIVAAYGEVRGFVRALQYGSDDGFDSTVSMLTIDDLYVDGVSITVGAPRVHVWSYAAGLLPAPNPGACPCSGGSSPPAFVGEDYLCDTANTDPDDWIYGWYPEDAVLWDGANPDPACPPGPFGDGWFVREIAVDPAEAIEVRLMTSQGQVDEDVGVSQMELFVR